MDSIIFDVDGTLWDSTDVVAKAWTDYLRQKEQIDLTITAGQLKTLFGKPLAEIAALVFPEYPENEQLRLIDGCCEAEHALLHITVPLSMRIWKKPCKFCPHNILFISSATVSVVISNFSLKKPDSPNISRDISVMEIPVLIKVPTSARLLIRMV